jgi:hypothetical protein
VIQGLSFLQGLGFSSVANPVGTIGFELRLVFDVALDAAFVRLLLLLLLFCLATATAITRAVIPQAYMERVHAPALMQPLVQVLVVAMFVTGVLNDSLSCTRHAPVTHTSKQPLLMLLPPCASLSHLLLLLLPPLVLLLLPPPGAPCCCRHRYCCCCRHLVHPAAAIFCHRLVLVCCSHPPAVRRA